MGRYTGPKARVNRALGTLIYEDSGAVRALERRNQPPGMHLRRRKPSNYGLALAEKKKIKHYYGISEAQLRRYFDLARRQPENTGIILLLLCERRLDNVIRRAGFTLTRPQARQGVVHGHFQVNERKVDRPSYLVEAGDVLSVRNRPNIQALYRAGLEKQEAAAATWLQVEPEHLRITVTRLPDESDISLPVEIARVVEILSR
jgi:small subunit ribosomal protein S4